jgi:hypothetical protein
MTAPTLTTEDRLPLNTGREPGVYPDVPIDEYHGDKTTLSSSGARKLLPPSCPALFRWEQDNPPAPKQVFDFGSAAHQMVLGGGPDLGIVDAPDWRTADARQERDDIRAEGGVPLLRHEYDQVQAMADAVRRHPVASALFDVDHGRPEQSLYWRHHETGVQRRARLDWLPDSVPGRRMVIPDFKTSPSADLESISKSSANYGYYMQAAWYLDAVRALGLAEKPAFVFVFQMKTPPYLISVVELDQNAIDLGRSLNTTALHIYRECVESSRWPDFCDGEIPLISLPAWVESQYR